MLLKAPKCPQIPQNGSKWLKMTNIANFNNCTSLFNDLLSYESFLNAIFIYFSGCYAISQQYFRVKPFDTEVGQMGTVIIPCEVGDRRGRVQWTKDGLTLGKLYFQFLFKI